MKFNNGTEKRKFEKQWEVLRKEYAKAGMSEEAIREMYQYDWEVYKQERRFREHNQYIEESVFDEETVLDEGKNSLLQKHQEKFSLRDSYHISEKHQWIEDIDTEKIRNVLECLSESNKEILTMYVIEERTQEEIAAHLGISRSAVADRISVIRKKLKKVLDWTDKKYVFNGYSLKRYLQNMKLVKSLDIDSLHLDNYIYIHQIQLMKLLSSHNTS